MTDSYIDKRRKKSIIQSVVNKRHKMYIENTTETELYNKWTPKLR